MSLITRIYERNDTYSVWTMIFLFFGCSAAGWLWEVGLHYIQTGQWVNRGVLHGPLLPIYGIGCDLLLFTLRRLKAHPAVELMLSALLCGVIEYLTSYLLERLYHQMKWWDYTGYFLNLHGRICAASLILFGLAGLVVLYFIAPVLNRMVQHIPVRKQAILAGAMLLIFCMDLFWSVSNPNCGPGITETQTALTADFAEYPEKAIQMKD